MDIAVNLPDDGAPKIRALADQLQQMAKDLNNQYSDRHFRDTAIGGLISIVAELERDIDELKSDAASAKRQATFDDMQYRSLGGR